MGTVPDNQPTVLKGDPAYRRRVFLVYGISVLLGVVLVVALTELGFPMLDDYVRRIGDAAGLRLLKAIAIGSVLPMLGAFIYVFRLGRRIQATEQIPAPGAKVIRDTVVIYGSAARRRGTFLIVVSVSGMLGVLVFVVLFARF